MPSLREVAQRADQESGVGDRLAPSGLERFSHQPRIVNDREDRLSDRLAGIVYGWSGTS